jgi:hypothetical protein
MLWCHNINMRHMKYYKLLNNVICGKVMVLMVFELMTGIKYYLGRTAVMYKDYRATRYGNIIP